MYLNVDEVEAALAVTAGSHPDIAELIELPNKTWEGRKSHAVRIGDGTPRCAVYFIGGVHAREWGSPDILVSFVERLTEAFKAGTGISFPNRNFSSNEVRTIVETLDVLVFPQVNPDGRAWSMNPNGYELWRKNRRPAPTGNPCMGVDVNRNYDWLWDFPSKFAPNAGVVNSTNPCDDTYIGPSATSEPETKNVVWLLDQNPHVGFFIDVHSYSELVLHPWGDDDNQTTDPNQNFQNPAFDNQRGLAGGYGEYIDADDLATLQAIGTKMSQAIAAVNGNQYTVQQGVQLYPTAGTSEDFMYARHLVDPTEGKVLSYVIEWGPWTGNAAESFHPPWATMETIIEEVVCGLLEFCLAAAEECTPRPNPLDLRRWAAVITILFGVIQDGGGWGITPGGKPIPIDPWGPLHLSAEKRDILLGLAVTELAEAAAGSPAAAGLRAQGMKMIRDATRSLSR